MSYELIHCSTSCAIPRSKSPTRHITNGLQKFAEQLKTSTENYGDAVLYYARAHAADKIQEVLRTLVAHCLVKSVAYPPLSELDASLRKLVTTPKKTLTELAVQDAEAAELLSKSLSGYATIRKFYDLRDEEVLLKDGEKPEHRPLTRKRIFRAQLTAFGVACMIRRLKPWSQLTFCYPCSERLFSLSTVSYIALQTE